MGKELPGCSPNSAGRSGLWPWLVPSPLRIVLSLEFPRRAQSRGHPRLPTASPQDPSRVLAYLDLGHMCAGSWGQAAADGEAECPGAHCRPKGLPDCRVGSLLTGFEAGRGLGGDDPPLPSRAALSGAFPGGTSGHKPEGSREAPQELELSGAEPSRAEPLWRQWWGEGALGQR